MKKLGFIGVGNMGGAIIGGILKSKKVAAEDMIGAYGADKVLFGTDSPWGGQKQSLELFGQLKLTEAEKEKILCLNAKRVLGI